MNIDLKQGRLDVANGQIIFKYTFIKRFIILICLYAFCSTFYSLAP